MTVLDDRRRADCPGGYPRPAPRHLRASRRSVPDRPRSVRPAAAPLRYHGTGVRISHAEHTRRPVSTAVSIALAGTAALITLWLGLLAQVSADRAPSVGPQQDRLTVVQVQAGETLHQLAGRIAPDAPTGLMVQQIRELNKLDSAAVDAGQTLIAPIG